MPTEPLPADPEPTPPSPTPPEGDAWIADPAAERVWMEESMDRSLKELGLDL